MKLDSDKFAILVIDKEQEDHKPAAEKYLNFTKKFNNAEYQKLSKPRYLVVLHKGTGALIKGAKSVNEVKYHIEHFTGLVSGDVIVNLPLSLNHAFSEKLEETAEYLHALSSEKEDVAMLIEAANKGSTAAFDAIAEFADKGASWAVDYMTDHIITTMSDREGGPPEFHIL